jgi:hypothetical protein
LQAKHEEMMKNRLYIIAFVFLTFFTANAQRSKILKIQTDETNKNIVATYIDSLNIFKLNHDSLNINNMDSFMNCHYSQLFTPLTFYNSVSKHQMEIDSNIIPTSTELIDRALLNVYLNRPDLVMSDERSMYDEKNKVMTETPSAIKSHPDIVSIIAPTPVEPDDRHVDNILIRKPNFWKYSGDSYLQFIQNYVSSNWYKGGESNYSLVGSLTLQDNYNNKQKVKWDNKLEMKLGFQTSRSDTLHKFKTSEDLIRYTSKIGLQATKKWYYTFQLIAASQFLRSFKSNDNEVYSDFMSPFTLNASLGMDYNMNWFHNNLTGNIHIAPLAYNFKYVDRISLATRYGIDEGKHAKNDFGSEITIDFSWKFKNNISWKSHLYAYTSYSRTEIDMENTIAFQLTRLLSANIFIFPRFDDSRERDDHHGYWELKEYSSIGFTYSF